MNLEMLAHLELAQVACRHPDREEWGDSLHWKSPEARVRQRSVVKIALRVMMSGVFAYRLEVKIKDSCGLKIGGQRMLRIGKWDRI